MSTKSFLKLLHFNDRIQDIDYKKINTEINYFREILEKQIPSFSNKDNHNKLLQEFIKIQDLIENTELKNLKKYFNEIIKKREGYYLKKSYELYENNFINYTWKEVLQTYKQRIPEETKKAVIGKIGKYSRWEAAGLELSPGRGDFTDQLIALDPLYIADKHEEILKKIKDKFNESYQKKLRSYVYVDTLDKLPQEQFGLIFSWGYFERVPLDIIKTYLKMFYNLLKPGGAVLLSYNNCMYKRSLDITSMGARAYNTKEYMETLVYSMGFNEIQSTDLEPNYTLLEFKKPGIFASQRAGQSILYKKQIDF